jgi:hypothetical protein
MNNKKLKHSIKINLISSAVMLSVLGIFLVIFFFTKDSTGVWPLEVWGIITILLVLIFSLVYQITGGFNNITETVS